MQLTDRVVLVTGGAQRLGRAIARSLAQRQADVIISYRSSHQAARDTVSLLRRCGVRAEAIRADISNATDVKRLFRRLSAQFGRLDVLVNNASVFYPTPVGRIEASHWEELFGANVRVPLFLSQAVAPALAKTRGSIVNIVDIHAERPLKGYPVYTASKAALAGLTRALALELAPDIRVNGVAPGAIAWPEDGQFAPPERRRILATTPLGRLGGFEEIAQAVHYLCAARYVTGQILAVDGGRSVFI